MAILQLYIQHDDGTEVRVEAEVEEEDLEGFDAVVNMIRRNNISIVPDGEEELDGPST